MLQHETIFFSVHYLFKAVFITTMVENSYYTSDYAVESLKTRPHSMPAEQYVLGALMRSNKTWDDITSLLIEKDFYRKEHQFIFQAITHLAESQSPFDAVTVSDTLDRMGKSSPMGSWFFYVGTIINETSSAANIIAYANIVRDYSILRQLIDVGTDISNFGFSPNNQKPQELLQEAEKRVLGIAEQVGRVGGFQPIKTLLAHAVDKIENLFEQEGHITGAATGFTDFDEKTSGLQPADLVIIAGRPSMGKTTIAMNIAENIAIRSKKPVAVFSMEMPGDSLVMRMMSSLGRIDQLNVRTGKLKEDEWPRLTSAINLLAATKFFIDDTPALTPMELSSRARRLAREHGQLGLIVVDYLQLMQSPSSGDNRVQQISDISRSLKALAKELHVPVIALSQLNRNLEQRPNKRPVMSDLRESGAIEQDADLIVFVYRDEVYNEDSSDKGMAEIIIGKQRNGPLGVVRLTFLGKYTRFENFAGNMPSSEDDE